MKYAIILFTLCLSQSLFAQKEDSLMLVIDGVELSSLNAPTETRMYFGSVSNLFLGIQNTRQEVFAEFGFRSPQHDSILIVEKHVNEFLLLKMREYLSYHPYPTTIPGDTIKLGDDDDLTYIENHNIASTTVIKIFVHAAPTQENLDLNRLYFPRFYQAYLRKDLYSSDLWNLLHGLYRQVKHEDYLNLELTEDQQIEIMIDQLQLKRKE